MTRFLPVCLMVLAALGAGLAMVPSAWELAFMKLRDKDFPSAERVFEDKFLAGDRTREVLLPLSELYVRNGRIDKAIGVLTKFAKANPDDRDVAERLSVLLREAQDAPRAIETLEKLAAKNATPKDLRELDRLHDIAQDPEGRFRALMRLAKMGAATAPESLTLTSLLAASGRKPEALTAAYNALKRFGAKTPHELVQVFAALAIDTNRPDLVSGQIAPWAAAQSSAVPLGAVASALVDKGAPADAIKLIEASTAFAHKDPATFVLAAQLESTHGSKAKALSLYEGLRAAGRLPPAQDAAYVSLALAQTQMDAALAHVSARGPQAFNDALLIYVIGRAAIESKTEWLKELDTVLAGLNTRRASAARTALALGDHDRAAKLAKDAEAQEATVSLAQLYADLGDLPSAARVFDASAPDPAAVDANNVPQAAAVAIALKRGPEALALTERLVAQDKSVDAAVQHARALTLNGRAAEALEKLAKLNAKSELSEIAMIEALSAAKRYAELREKLVARLLQPNLAAAQRTNIIYLMNDLTLPWGADAAPLADGLAAELNGAALTGAPREARVMLLSKIAPAKALPFLKAAAEADPDKQGYAYAKLLKGLKRTAELNAYLALAARTAKTAKVRDDFLYELLKSGASREALPLLAERARSDGAKWFFAYDEALKKYGTRADRLAALNAFAAQPTTPRELRGQLAFQILELGDKASAEPLFRSLAAGSGPKSPEVRQLLFLWGPRPPADARAWLKQRAADAPDADRAAWAAILANAGDTGAAEALLAGDSDPEAIAALANVYVESRNAKALSALVDSALPSADRRTAKALATSASALSLSAPASLAYEKAGLPGPAGREAFFAGDHRRAIALLDGVRNDAEASFYLAESLTALNRPREAAAHYRAALSGLSTPGDGAKLRIIAMARLRDHAGAERELAQMRGEPGEEADARNAYAGALLDQGDTRRAAAQLNQ
jgi:cellulose synthase operon protein C